MSGFDVAQIILFFAVLTAAVKPLGSYMARVYEGEPVFLTRVFGPVERFIYRVCGVGDEEMDWKSYAKALGAFSLVDFVALYALQRLQGVLPLNPQGFGGLTRHLSFNTAASFVSNTNWQAYGGESTMSHLTQMLGLGVQNFVSAAAGIAVLVALIRGLTRRSALTIGNFWRDLVRGTLYIFAPLSLVLALALVAQGVPQTFHKDMPVELTQSIAGADGQVVTEQTISVGPVASQVAIKQLGTNGGGFYNVNSAHPLENPTPLSNFLQMLSILLIPAALTYTFGRMARSPRQGWVLYAAMLIVTAAALGAAVWAESVANPQLTALGMDASAGNMEGKEVRFGIANSALWATATTAASNGSVNSMHDSFMPLGGLVPLVMIQLGEVIFGGVGSGLYGLLMFVFVAVFVAGLMIGRTPEYLGKKIEAFEMKMASVVILIPALLILVGTAAAVLIPKAASAIANPGAHGFSEILYAFSSAAGNNGSAFAGLSANQPFYNYALGFAMLAGRFLIMLPVLAAAGSLGKKNIVPQSAGTLPTHTPLFVGLLVATVMLVGALTFIPALALGPIVEHLTLFHP
ncbi:MAG: potassium-transporting ATPase subunit KdpA [Deltaproteobacteria bacterium]|nr:potassium-transporting ATPase subunit KdpA [Deltaproteobacteria bacterium]